MDRRDFLGMTAAGAFALPHRIAPRGSVAARQVDDRFDRIARLVERTMAEYRTTGVALAVDSGGAVFTRGFGLTNIGNPQPVTPDTVFPIASISKTVVGTAMMRLHDDGHVDVEAPVADYLPDFRVADADATRDVRIWHLLTHTPGWEGQLGTPDRGPATLENFVETLRDLPQIARPGEVPLRRTAP